MQSATLVNCHQMLGTLSCQRFWSTHTTATYIRIYHIWLYYSIRTTTCTCIPMYIAIIELTENTILLPWTRNGINTVCQRSGGQIFTSGCTSAPVEMTAKENFNQVWQHTSIYHSPQWPHYTYMHVRMLSNADSSSTMHTSIICMCVHTYCIHSTNVYTEGGRIRTTPLIFQQFSPAVVGKIACIHVSTNPMSSMCLQPNIEKALATHCRLGYRETVRLT